MALRALDLCARQRVDMVHVQQVAALAADIFDRTAIVHSLDPRYQDLAYFAGLLHEIGMSLDPQRPELAAAKLLRKTPLIDLSDEDRVLVAAAITFNRGPWRAERLEQSRAFRRLPLPRQPVALWIAAILRIADGMDYARSHATRIVRCDATLDSIAIELSGPFSNFDAERAQARADMWRQQFGMRFQVRARQERGLSKLLRPASSASAGSHPRVQPDMPVTEVARGIINHYRLEMLAKEGELRAGEEVNGVHKMRVAIRRMRTALRIFQPYFDRWVHRLLVRGLRTTAWELGPARDLDVLGADLARFADTLTPEDAEKLAFFRDYVVLRRNRTRQGIASYLDGDHYRAFLNQIAFFCENPGVAVPLPPAGDIGPVLASHAAAELVYLNFQRIRIFETLSIEDMPNETLHELRIRIKRLRYTLEAFRQLLGPEADRVVRTMVDAQETFGDFQDGVVALHLLDRLDHALECLARNGKKKVRGHAIPMAREGLALYRARRLRQMEEARKGFGAAWDQLTSAELRRDLALAVSTL